MIKRVNSTGRRRILRDHAKISINPLDDGSYGFSAYLDLSHYGLPSDADVFVEAYRRSTLMRFPFGKVSYPRPLATPALTEFKSPDGILFRVKVIDFGEQKGMLLAEGDIPASNDKERPEDRIALLPPRAEDLGDELWRIEFPLSRESSPELLINEKLLDWKATAQTTEFRALVFPAAVRQVLERIFYSGEDSEIDDEDSWMYNWIKFAESLPGVENHPRDLDGDETAWVEWINTVCDRFASTFNFLDTFMQQQTGEDG